MTLSEGTFQPWAILKRDEGHLQIVLPIAREMCPSALKVDLGDT